jgi:hypothetical protein
VGGGHVRALTAYFPYRVGGGGGGHGSGCRACGRRHEQLDQTVPGERAATGPGRSPQAPGGDEVAATGDGPGPSSGRPAGRDALTGPALADQVRLAQAGGAAERPAPVHHHDRRPGHPLPARALETRRRAADDHHARLAGLGPGDAEGDRAADRPDRPRRQRGRRVPSGHPVDAGLRLLRQADDRGLEPGPHGPRLADPDGPPRLRALRVAGRRLGLGGVGRDGPAETAGPAGHPRHHGRPRSRRRSPASSRPATLRRPAWRRTSWPRSTR